MTKRKKQDFKPKIRQPSLKGAGRGRDGNVLLLVPQLAGFGAVGSVGQLGRVEGGALLAGGVGGVGG